MNCYVLQHQVAISFADQQHETLLAKMSIDPKFVELTADVLEIFLLNISSISQYLPKIRPNEVSSGSL